MSMCGRGRECPRSYPYSLMIRQGRSSCIMAHATCTHNYIEPQNLLTGQAEGGSASGSPRSPAAAAESNTNGAALIRAEFKSAMQACAGAANSDKPTLSEPIITIVDSGSQTCDPCSLVSLFHLFASRHADVWALSVHVWARMCRPACLSAIVCAGPGSMLLPTCFHALVSLPCCLQRVQDQIQQWVREGHWDRVVQEKRNVLVCMQQVRPSAHLM